MVGRVPCPRRRRASHEARGRGALSVRGARDTARGPRPGVDDGAAPRVRGFARLPLGPLVSRAGRGTHRPSTLRRGRSDRPRALRLARPRAGRRRRAAARRRARRLVAHPRAARRELRRGRLGPGAGRRPRVRPTGQDRPRPAPHNRRAPPPHGRRTRPPPNHAAPEATPACCARPALRRRRSGAPQLGPLAGVLAPGGPLFRVRFDQTRLALAEPAPGHAGDLAPWLRSGRGQRLVHLHWRLRRGLSGALVAGKNARSAPLPGVSGGVVASRGAVRDPRQEGERALDVHRRERPAALVAGQRAPFSRGASRPERPFDAVSLRF